jgi:hypothetical protein
LREADPQFGLLDGTLAECDRLGDGRADCSAKHRRHGVNVHVVTDPHGQVLWLPPALPGRCHDLTAARTHQGIRIYERQGVPILAHRAHIGAGAWVGDHIGKTACGRRTDAHPTDRQPSAVEGPGHGRGWNSPPEALADLPQSSMQPESNDVNRSSSPHTGAATLKELTDRVVRAVDSCRAKMHLDHAPIAIS